MLIPRPETELLIDFAQEVCHTSNDVALFQYSLIFSWTIDCMHAASFSLAAEQIDPKYKSTMCSSFHFNAKRQRIVLRGKGFE